VAGATAGGVAALVRLPTGPVLLCGNLAWTKEQYLYARFPGLLFDRTAWWEKVWRLKKFKELVPELVVLPDHDWATAESVKESPSLSVQRQDKSKPVEGKSQTSPRKDIVLHPFAKE